MVLFAADPDPWKVLASLATVVGLVIGLVMAYLKPKKSPRQLEREFLVEALRKARKKVPKPLADFHKDELRRLEMPEGEIAQLEREFESEYQRSLPPEERSNRWSS